MDIVADKNAPNSQPRELNARPGPAVLPMSWTSPKPPSWWRQLRWQLKLLYVLIAVAFSLAFGFFVILPAFFVLVMSLAG